MEMNGVKKNIEHENAYERRIYELEEEVTQLRSEVNAVKSEMKEKVIYLYF